MQTLLLSLIQLQTFAIDWYCFHSLTINLVSIFLLSICYQMLQLQQMSPADFPRLTRPRGIVVLVRCTDVL